MLYDNAQLIQLYLDAHLASGEERYARVVRDIVRYVVRDMTHPEGGFYSAEDADSEGQEGKFYCWTLAELTTLLSPEELKVATRHFGVTEAGNFEDHSHPDPLKQLNVLSLADTNLTAAEATRIGEVKAKLFQARSRRVRPHLDDKILATWNGLMLGAVARASAVLGDADYLKAAEKNLAFVRARLWDDKTRTLYSRWRDGERTTVQLQEAYAFMLSGVLDLYEATLRPEHLQFAIDLANSMLARFYDATAGGFWQSEAGSKDLIVRIKEDYDGAEPSGNSVAILALLRLSALTEQKAFGEAARKSLALFSDRMEQVPQAVPYMLMGLSFSLEEPRRLVITGGADTPEGLSLLRAAHGVFQPHKVVLSTEGPVEPFARTLPAMDNQPTAYVCTGNACLPPTHDPAKVKELLTRR
jgi:uncharacterized protein YyaL (SSP411 family)